MNGKIHTERNLIRQNRTLNRLELETEEVAGLYMKAMAEGDSKMMFVYGNELIKRGALKNVGDLW